MASSDHSQGGGAHPEQGVPQQPSHQNQPSHHQPPQPQPPHAPQQPGMPPQEAYQQAHQPQPPYQGEPAPQAQQPQTAQPQGDDYYYPQGQNVLPDVPPVAMPPAMHAQDPAQIAQQIAAEAAQAEQVAQATQALQAAQAAQAAQAQQPLAAAPEYTAPQAYAEQAPVEAPLMDQGAGEQISQRLAQLQNQYDQEVASAAWQPEEVAIAGDPNHLHAQQPQHFEPQVPQPPQYEAQVPPQAHYEQPAPVEPQMAQPDPYQQQAPAAEHYNPHMPPPQAEAQQAYGEYAPQDPMQAAQQAAAQHAAYDPQHMQQQAFDPQGGQFAQPQGEYAPQPQPADQNYQPAAFEQPADSHQVSYEEPTGGGLKKVMLGGAFAAALAVGGGGAYTYKYTDMFSGGQSGPTPVVKANGAPVKTIKNAANGAQKSLNSAMHDRLSGGGSDPIAERLSSEKARLDKKVAAAKTGMMPSKAKAQGGARKVKTLIVRPDGTVIQPAGGADMAAVVANNPMISPGISADTLNRVKGGAQKSAAKTAGIRRMKSVSEVSAARNAGRSSARVVSRGSSAVAKTAPRVSRSLDMGGEAVSEPVVLPGDRKTVTTNRVRTVRIQPNGAPSSVTAGAIGSPYVVQVTARNSQTGALAAFADMQQRYPSLIGTYEPDIQRADLGAKGVWYRLRVGPVASKPAAQNLCSQLKAAGHPGCFVRKK